MPTKKTAKETGKYTNKRSSTFALSEDEINALLKKAEANMKKHGFQTVDELEAYYDSKRGY